MALEVLSSLTLNEQVPADLALPHRGILQRRLKMPRRLLRLCLWRPDLYARRKHSTVFGAASPSRSTIPHAWSQMDSPRLTSQHACHLLESAGMGSSSPQRDTARLPMQPEELVYSPARICWMPARLSRCPSIGVLDYTIGFGTGNWLGARVSVSGQLSGCIRGAGVAAESTAPA